MVKNTPYLDRFKDTIKDLSAEFGIAEEDIREIIDHFFLTLKKFITDIRMPTIKISMWGTFKPTIGKINWGIDQTLYHMNLEHGDREVMFRKIRRIQRIKERLLQEKGGKSTWKLWRNKTEEDLEAENQE